MTTKTTIDLSSAVAASRALVVAKDAFEKAMMAIERAIEPLSDDEFWSMVEAFRERIISGFPMNQNTKDSVHNLHCDMPETGSAKALKFIRFVKAWEAKTVEAYHPLFGVIQDRSDDSYGDLLDSFPLVGREVYEKALAGYYGKEYAVKDAVCEALGERVTASATSRYLTDEENVANAGKALTWLLSHIFQGENYIGMRLEEKGREIFQWEMAPIPCNGDDCDQRVSPVIGVDPQGLCDYCSLDDDY